MKHNWIEVLPTIKHPKRVRICLCCGFHQEHVKDPSRVGGYHWAPPIVGCRAAARKEPPEASSCGCDGSSARKPPVIAKPVGKSPNAQRFDALHEQVAELQQDLDEFEFRLEPDQEPDCLTQVHPGDEI